MPVLIDMKNKLLRYNTRVFIQEQPTTVIAKRKVWVSKPGGGHDNTNVTLPAQVVRLIPQGISSGEGYSANDDGEVHKTDYILLAQYDADFAIDDTWTTVDGQFRVTDVISANGYEIRVHVTCFSKKPSHA